MLKWRQAGSNKSSIGKARGNSGDLNGGGFGGGGSGSGSGSGRLGDDGNYGLTDYRLIPRWHFVTQPFLEQEDKANMTIGTLYVKVVEARGLMASDLSGRSDPYIRLCLTGRYLSHGQEWSENLRLHQQTKTIKYTLDPVWDEEFTFPVRRAGALLKVEVWDWDRSSPDDPLGHFQVKIGEEMLSQEPMDMWYVLEAPRGMTVSAASAAAKAKRQGNVSTEGRGSEPPQNISTSSDDLADQDDGDELNSSPYSPSEVGSSVAGGEGEKRDFTPGSFKLPKKSLPSIAKRFTITAPAEHSHASAEEASVCVTCIDIRRKMFGEVRLLMWFQFDEFAETCSHLWPEEPLQPEKMHFSPNQLYRKGMLFWEMFLPYLNFMREADAIMCWGRPWRSLGWLIALLGMLLVPLVLIFVVNMALVRIVISAYLKHNHHGVSGGGEGDGSGGRADAIDQSSRHSADLPPLFNDASTHVNLGSGRRISSGNAGATAVAANRRDSVFSAAFSTPPSTPNGVNGRSIHGAGGGGEGIGGSFVPSPGSVRSSVQSRKPSKRMGPLARILINNKKLGGRSFPDRDGRSLEYIAQDQSGERSASGRSANGEAGAAGATGSSGVGFDSGVPSLLNSPTLDRTNSNGSAVSRLSKDVSVTVARGGVAVADAAGAGKKKIKKLMPSRVTKDPEMDELNSRLGNTKKVPLVINEVGKRLLGKSGPGMQRQVEKLGMNLIKIRTWFHPLHAKHLVGMVSAITAHMLLQMWLYHAGRFNVYLAMVCLGQFMSKLYTRRGKAFVMAVKEANRSRRIRLAVTQKFALAPSSGPAHAILSQNASSRSSSGGGRLSFFSTNSSQASSHSSPASVSPLAIADGSSHSLATLPSSSRLDWGGVVGQHTLSFAPPGTTPASGSHRHPSAAGAHRRKSSFFDFSSPTMNRRESAAATAAARGNTTSNGGGVGGDGRSSHGDWSPEERGTGGSRSGRGRRGTIPPLGKPGLATVASSEAASDATSEIASGAGLSAGVLVRGGSTGEDGGRGKGEGEEWEEEGTLSPNRRRSHAAAGSARSPGVGSPGPGSGVPPASGGGAHPTSFALVSGGGSSGRKSRRWTLPSRRKGAFQEGRGGDVLGAVPAFKTGNGSAKGGKDGGVALRRGKGRGAAGGGGGSDSFFGNRVAVSAHGRVEGGGGGSGGGGGGGGEGGSGGGSFLENMRGRERERRSPKPGTLPPRHRPRRTTRRRVRWGRVLAALLTLFALTAAVLAAAAACIWGWNEGSAINDAMIAGRRWAHILKGNGITLVDTGRRWTMELLERFFGGGVAEARATGLDEAGS